ncbi:hypothetical protein ACE6ED_20285, partial [Paenibacillus sp. CN-4]|uniref:hypothetical protein n=1 Tax=Paenibacillus nanchangensis TaxID=3348343 RepID=UPI00397E7DEF
MSEQEKFNGFTCIDKKTPHLLGIMVVRTTMPTRKVRNSTLQQHPLPEHSLSYPSFGGLLKQLCIVLPYDFLAGLKGPYLLIIPTFRKVPDSDSLIYAESP